MDSLFAVRGALGPGTRTAPAAPSAAAPSRGGGFYGVLRRTSVGSAVGFTGGFACVRPIADEGSGRGGPSDALDADQPAIAHEPAAPGDAHDVGIDARHRVVDVVHVRLLDPHQDLVADLEGKRPLLDLSAGAALDHLEGVERQRVAALEVEVLAGLLLQLVERAVLAQELRRHLRVDAHQ